MTHSKPDNRIVLTLDAGGTNFVFNAVQDFKEILNPIVLPARHESLDIILQTIIDGFNECISKIPLYPSAVSFAFPGPAEYDLGIIGDLENLPLFRGGVALGPMLEKKFNIPVFINNDGDLFTYGEAIAGFLPYINQMLRESGSPKSYNNLLGVTFGTGFGGGIVSYNTLFTGDNNAQGEINRIRNKLYPDYSAEESTSVRGVQRVFAREACLEGESIPSPEEIFHMGSDPDHKYHHAAVKAFEELAVVAGDAVANAITLTDGLVVIGGGLSGAHSLFLPRLVEEMNHAFQSPEDKSLARMEIKAFNLENKVDLSLFLSGDRREIKIPYSETRIKYDPLKRTGVGISRLGTDKAVSTGAYAYALHRLNQSVQV